MLSSSQLRPSYTLKSEVFAHSKMQATSRPIIPPGNITWLLPNDRYCLGHVSASPRAFWGLWVHVSCSDRGLKRTEYSFSVSSCPQSTSFSLVDQHKRATLSLLWTQVILDILHSSCKSLP